jgi:two-component system KDP operon response regulator KdpE
MLGVDVTRGPQVNLQPPLRAAVVDDDRLTRLIVRRSLEGAGYVVEEGDTGAAALRLAQSHPDVMILDLHLPDMNGLAVCRVVTQDTAVVVLTASDDDAAVDQCYRVGAMDCLSKPISLDDFRARVGAAIRLRAENSPPRGVQAAPG